MPPVPKATLSSPAASKIRPPANVTSHHPANVTSQPAIAATPDGKVVILPKEELDGVHENKRLPPNFQVRMRVRLIKGPHNYSH